MEKNKLLIISLLSQVRTFAGFQEFVPFGKFKFKERRQYVDLS